MVCCETYEDRKYKRQWAGNINFLCGGTIVSTGNNPWPQVTTVSAMFIGIILLFAFPVRTVTERTGNHASVVVGLLLSIATIGFYFRTALMDPGILPRCPKPSRISTNGSRITRPPATQNFVGNKTVPMKYCEQCSIYQPPGTWHCTVCSNCVQKFDHHCPWIGNCVGRRNYRYFISFVFTVCTLVVFSFVMCILDMVQKSQDLKEEGRESSELFSGSTLGSLILALFSIAVSGFTFTLCFFHVYLLRKNVSTYDHIRAIDKRLNPNGQGCKPFTNVFCASLGYSYMSAWVANEEAKDINMVVGNSGDEEAIYSLNTESETIHIDFTNIPEEILPRNLCTNMKGNLASGEEKNDSTVNGETNSSIIQDDTVSVGRSVVSGLKNGNEKSIVES